MNLSDTKNILNAFSILPRHSLGQNFLVSENIAESIVSFSHISPKDNVIEIGPGIGALTEKIIAEDAMLTVYEIDHRMVEVLQSRFDSCKNLNIIESDILKIDLWQTYQTKSEIKIIANLPYYITSEIVEKLICEIPHSQSMCLMMQKEAAERLLLRPNDSRYGITAVLLALYGRVNHKLRVSADKFFPRPKVHSQVLYIENTADNCFVEFAKKNPDFQVAHFKMFLEKAFSMRRKTLYNNLRSQYPDLTAENIQSFLEKAGIDQKKRPEQIEPEVFWKLFLSMAK